MTSCPGYVRRLGHLREAVAIHARHGRCVQAWKGHLQNTKDFVLHTAESCLSRRTCIVLGSGLLIDFPLDDMARRFEEIVLVDIVHLPSVRKQAKRWPHVRTVQWDITGVAAEIARCGRNTPAALPLSRPSIPGLDEKTDLVISLNVLSQLTVCMRHHLAEELHYADAAALDAWEEGIMRDHYGMLRTLKCPVCLITDYEWNVFDRAGSVVETVTTVRGVTLPKADREWIWDIVPPGEVSKDRSVSRKVAAFSF